MAELLTLLLWLIATVVTVSAIALPFLAGE